MNFKSFGDFLNENEESLVFKAKFPWDKEIEETIKKLNSAIKYICQTDKKWWWERSQGVGSINSSRNTVSFNIKVYDYPDYEKFFAKTGLSEEELQDKWERFLVDTFDMFTEDLDYPWVEKTWASGRSGGWLTIKIDSDWAPDTIIDYAQDAISDYEDNTSSIAPATEKDLHDLRGSRAASNFGMKGTSLSSERAEELKEAEELSKSVLAEITDYLEKIGSIPTDLEEISRLIDVSRETIVEDFLETIEEDL